MKPVFQDRQGGGQGSEVQYCVESSYSLHAVTDCIESAAQDPGTGAKTLLYHIEVDRGIPWASAQGMLASSSAAAQVPA